MTEVHPDDLILVAVMKKRRDLEIARVLGWYRIPIQTAPKTVRVDWIAFYLTRAFGDEKWSIRYLSPVKGFELVTRRELLSDEADHLRVDEPYFKVQLGPLVQLAQPIPSRRWRRFTFLYTTGERLLKAQEISDLRVTTSKERDRLWRMLRDREAQQYFD
jgi:hypothetical protein